MTMRYLLFTVLAAVFFGASFTTSASGQFFADEPHTVIIPDFYYSAALQQKSEWCWAACIQMILKYYKVDITQQDIVARTWGVGPNGQLQNRAGEISQITDNLNKWSVDDCGTRYHVVSQQGIGNPSADTLLTELNKGKPVLLAIQLPGATLGHCVVAAGAKYVVRPDGTKNVISIIIFDPSPSRHNIQTRGMNEVPAADIASITKCYWRVSAQKSYLGFSN